MKLTAVTSCAAAIAVVVATVHAVHSSPLCVNGYPAQRNTHITYGGLPARYGYVRDHIQPLGLGGSDTADNVQYQPLAEARVKDKVEWYAIEGYCAQRLTLSQALEMVRNWRNEK